MADTFIPNPRQQQAIEHVNGPMLVLAGAGTGKTSVLVERIATLIEKQHALPGEILAVTFTENAAQEMKERVDRRLKRKAGISAATFNAYCQGILKRNRRDFQVLAPEDVYVFLRQRIERLGLQRFIRPASLGEFLYDLRNFFDRCHEELIGPQQFMEFISSLSAEGELPRNCKSKEIEELGPQEILARWQEIARAYANAMRLLQQEGLGTFGMQIMNAVGLLRAESSLLEQERKRARFILIDEFQDCNSSNITLAELLAGPEKNIFAVGDPDQAIYRFRGASSAAFEEFQKRFPETQGVVLEENQRSRGNILRVAFAAINENPDASVSNSSIEFYRVPLQSARDAREAEKAKLLFDDPVDALIGSSDEHEAADIAEEILELRRNRKPREEYSMAILYRSHLHRARIMEELAAREIPFLVKGMDILDTPAVRDLLAVARAVANPTDAESLFRMCAFPQFGILAQDLRERLSAAGGKSAFRAVLAAMEEGARVLAAVETAQAFVAEQKLKVGAAFSYLVRQFNLPHDDLAVRALLRFVAEWEKKPFARQNILPEFLNYLDFYEEGGGAIPMLSEEQLAAAQESDPEAVQLMTVHGAKGLEFTHVWLLKVTSNSFPTSYRESLFEFPARLRSSIAVGDSKEINEQEERRLFYVAITRARDRLTIGSRPGRGKDTTPSGFLRPLLQNRKLAGILQKRDAGRTSAVPPVPAEISAIGSWMLLPASFPVEGLALSANAVENYSLCPLKFKLLRDWKIPGDAAAALQFGSAVHTVLKNYYGPAPGAPDQTADDVITAFRHEFAKAVIEDATQRKLYQDRGEAQLRELVTSRPRSSVPVIATEAAFSFELGKLKIVGRIDRLDRIEGNAVRVVDYKTGAPRNQKDADDSLQLSIYAMGASQMQMVARELVLLNVQTNQEVVTLRAGSQLERARQKIQDAAEGIAAQAFSPKPGMHCRWCAFERLCPATEQRLLVPVRALTAGVDA